MLEAIESYQKDSSRFRWQPWPDALAVPAPPPYSTPALPKYSAKDSLVAVIEIRFVLLRSFHILVRMQCTLVS